MDTYSTLLNLNIMASMRTGHLVVDLLIAMLLPMVAGMVSRLVYEWWPSWLQYLFTRRRRGQACTLVTYNLPTPGRYDASLNENHILQDCLVHYVGSHMSPTQYTSATYRYQRLPSLTSTYTSLPDVLQHTYSLLTVPRAGAPVRVAGDVSLEIVAAGNSGSSSSSKGEHDDGDATQSTCYDDDYSGDSDDDDDGGERAHHGGGGQRRSDAAGERRHSSARERRHVMVLRSCPRTSKNNNKKNKNNTNDDDADEERDATYELARKALAWYCGAVHATVDHNRYLYQPLLPSPLGFGTPAIMAAAAAEESDEQAASLLTCRRYVLSSDKTFNTLFFPQKQRLLALMDAFQRRSGRYAVAGVPHRMVLLLHGPPGTGKTSLIKAMAAHLQRHIFSIDLARVRTNRQLRDLMHDTRVRVTTQHGSDASAYECGGDDNGGNRVKRLRCHQVIYVLEDIDATAAMRAVHAQSTHKSNDNSNGQRDDSGGDDDDDDGSDDDVSSSSSGMLVDRVYLGGTSAAAGGGAQARTRRALEQELLSVSGVLDALGGILDAPRRIVVLTSNHVEHLHPALLRPGVVTMRLYMGAFTEACALEMVRHYFADDDDVHDAATTAAVCEAVACARRTRNGLSPAEVEQMCAESDTVHELLQRLQQGSRTELY